MANGNNNADGQSHNRSWNCGVEGPTEDPQVRTPRARQKRNSLIPGVVAQLGVPWARVIGTAQAAPPEGPPVYRNSKRIPMEARSLVVLRHSSKEANG